MRGTWFGVRMVDDWEQLKKKVNTWPVSDDPIVASLIL